MIKELHVSGYRAIRQCNIKDLAQVNIFVGKNNSGKSSLLESIYLLSSAVAPEDPLGRNKVEYLIARRSLGRRLSWDTGKEILWHGYRVAEQVSVSAILPLDILRVKLYHLYQGSHALIDLSGIDLPSIVRDYDLLSIPREELIDSRRKLPTIPMKARYGLGVSELVRDVFREYDKLESYMKSVVLIDPGLINRFKRFEEKIWPRLLERRLDKQIMKVIREGYDIDVEDLTYIPYGRRYELVVKLSKTFARIDDLGDGARYSIYMISLAGFTQNSALLIEEPENHQHPYGLYRTVDMILDLAKQNNTQLFISTHSIEFIELLREANKKHRIDTAVFYLERDSEGIVTARRLTLEDIDVLRKIGIDARFLYAI